MQRIDNRVKHSPASGALEVCMQALSSIAAMAAAMDQLLIQAVDQDDFDLVVCGQTVAKQIGLIADVSRLAIGERAYQSVEEWVLSPVQIDSIASIRGAA